MIKAVIFDADGTLIDSMAFWHNVLNDYLTELGLDVSIFPLDKIEHMNTHEASEYVISFYNLDATPEELTKYIENSVVNFFKSKVELKPNVKQMLDYLKSKSVKMIIATGTDTPLIKCALIRNNIADYFCDVICCKDVGKRKTEPDVYRFALEKVGTTREDTLVVEDALYCLRTAKADGFKVLAVYDSEEKNQAAMKAEADCYSADLSDFEEIFEKLN